MHSIYQSYQVGISLFLCCSSGGEVRGLLHFASSNKWVLSSQLLDQGLGLLGMVFYCLTLAIHQGFFNLFINDDFM